MFEFEIKNVNKKARTGFLNTLHGKLATPNLAIVATHGHIKLLDKKEEKLANPELTISNTFHLFVNKKVSEIKKAGGLHKWSGLKNPIMTDSGGFQVFSLGWGKVHNTGKILGAENLSSLMSSERQNSSSLITKICHPVRLRLGSPGKFSIRSRIFKTPSAIFAAERFSASKVAITEKGVFFSFNNKKYELTPEKSMKIQKDLGADIIFAFDECTSPLHSYAYTKKAMERTHRWAIRSLEAAQNKKQALFGIVQGGVYDDLRRKSSKFIGSLPFDGFGIGGCFGEKQMRKSIGWSLSGLPIDKPRHLLGIGKIKDIFISVRQGIDLFDCVVPTREARHGVIYTKNGKLNITKGVFGKDRRLIEKNCGCFVCQQGITRQEIHHFRVNPLLKTKNPRLSASKGQKLATLHNIYFFKNLFAEIREAIVNNKLEKLEQKYYNYSQ